MVTTTQQNAALVEEAAAAASSLDEQALRLGQAVSVFKVDTGARGAGVHGQGGAAAHTGKVEAGRLRIGGAPVCR